MEGPNAVLNVVTLPPGATKTQARMVIDGVRGAIFFYGPGGPLGALVASWASAAGTDPYGNAYPLGLSVGGIVVTGTRPFILYNINGPGANNLFFTVSVGATTDSFNNSIIQGISAFYKVGATYFLVNIAGLQSPNGIAIYSAASQAGPWTLVNPYLDLFNADPNSLELINAALSHSAQLSANGILTFVEGLGNSATMQFGTDGTSHGMVINDFLEITTTTAPTGVISAPVLFASSVFDLQCLSGFDNGTYLIGHQEQASSTSLVLTTSPQVVASIPAVSTGRYHVTGWSHFTGGTGLGTLSLGFDGTAVVSHADWNFQEVQNGAAGPLLNNVAGGAAIPLITTPALANGIGYSIWFDLTVTFSGAGTFNLRDQVSVANTATSTAAFLRAERAP